MNNFIIAVGTGIVALTQKAAAVADQIGKVSVDMGDTACRVPDAGTMITKIAALGRIGRKRKTVRC
jgi:hypothetical protein